MNFPLNIRSLRHYIHDVLEGDGRHRRLTAPALLGNYLAVGDLEGYVHLISRRDGRLLGFERVAKDRIGHQPVVDGGAAYVYANDGTLAALRAGAAALPAPGASVSGAGAASKVEAPAADAETGAEAELKLDLGP